MIEHLKLVIAKIKRERFGQSSERGGRVLKQLKLHSLTWGRLLRKIRPLPRWRQWRHAYQS